MKQPRDCALPKILQEYMKSFSKCLFEIKTNCKGSFFFKQEHVRIIIKLRVSKDEKEGERGKGDIFKKYRKGRK